MKFLRRKFHNDVSKTLMSPRDLFWLNLAQSASEIRQINGERPSCSEVQVAVKSILYIDTYILNDTMR